MSSAAGDALAAIDLVADAGLSLTIRGRPGPVVDLLLERLAAKRAILRVASSAEASTLTGGLDPLATIAAGRPVRRPSLAERVDSRVLLFAGADRAAPELAAMLAGWIDDDAFGQGLVLLDEGGEEEGVPGLLADRTAMWIDADALHWRDFAAAGVEAPARWEGDAGTALVEASVALGIGSLRAPLLALRTARAAGGDVALAARLVFAPRARIAPPPPEDREEEAEEDSGGSTSERSDCERLIDAVRTALPEGLVEGGGPSRSGGSTGSSAARGGSSARGRLGGVRKGQPGREGRLDLVATLVAAAPMQRLRERPASAPPSVRRNDLRVRRRLPRQRHATVIAVDASGSAASARLGEVKGAVEQLLARSYVRRDEVALIAFRGKAAETLLPPTRSLARAQRELAALPGGGGTPLAAGIEAGMEQAVRSRAEGRSTLFVLLTDGGANIALDGSADRPAASRDAEAAARRVASLGLRALVIDSSPRGAPPVRALAEAMGARYLALPRADDRSIAAAIGAGR